MPDIYVPWQPPTEERRYRNADGSETIHVPLQIRPDVQGQGRLFAEVTAEALEDLLARAGFHRIDPDEP